MPLLPANIPFARAVWLFLVVLPIAAPLRAQQLIGTGHLPVLTRVADIRRLNADEANRGYPIRLRAVVTYFAPPNPNLLPGERYSLFRAPDMFIQDSSAGIFVNVPREGPSAQPGQLIEIEGISESPDFSPQIGQPRWRVIGQARLPVAKPVSFERLASTAEDSQFVSVQGIVRAAEKQGGQLVLDVAVSGGSLRAIVPEFSAAALETLPDAEVRIRGVCGALFNQKNQLIGVLLYAAGLHEVRITRQAPPEPFAAALQPLSSLQRFTLEGLSGHRVHVRGVVVFQQPGSLLYISDGKNGLRVETRQSNGLRPGDIVDVLGFPHLADLRPVLEDATFQRHGVGPPPRPLDLTAKQLLEGDYDSTLVSIEARLLEKSLLPERQTLLLQAGDLMFNAAMEGMPPDSSLASLRKGSRVRVVGICLAQKGRNGQNQSFRLLVDRPADIALVSQPPWWTLQRALGAVGTMLLAVMATFTWVAVLRRRVKQQTADIRLRYEQEALLEENYRRLFTYHPHPMWVFDLQTHRFLAVNEAAVTHYGYSSEEFLAMTIFQVRPAEEIPRLKQILIQFTEGLQVCGRWTHRKKDGTLIEVEVASHELSFAGKRARLVVATDVTEHEKTKRLDRTRRDVVELIAQSRPLDQIMRGLIDMVKDQAPGLVVSVLQLGKGRFSYLASSLPQGVVQATDGVVTHLGAEHTDNRVSFGWRSVLDATETDPFWSMLRDAALREGLQTCWPAPIITSSGRVLGAFAVCHRDARSPSAAELELIDMAGQIAAVAIEQRQLHDRLLFQAHHDLLTGLPNRLLLNDRLEQCLARAQRGSTSFAVLQIDLDRFKLINDSLGHAAGDTLLQAVGDRLKSRVRQTDTLARVGGDEFTLLLTDLNKPESAREVAEELLAALQEPFDIQGSEIFVGSSIGIAIYPQDSTDSHTLTKKADAAMYRAKTTGKNRWHGFAPEMEPVENRLELDSDLHRALDRQELEVFYQPLFNTAEGSLASMEALLRWRHPRLGLVPPSQFIPIAEESGLVVQIGSWVLKEACYQLRKWQQPDSPACKVSVNVSAVQFAREDFIQLVSSILAETGLQPANLELELTESVVMHDLALSARKMAELRALGVSIAIDDFGTGYSALSYLQQLPVDYLKIDRSFVQEISGGTNPPRLIQAIVTMAHGLGIKVTAEGVETEQQLAALREMGCDQVQGYLLGRPLPVSEAVFISRLRHETEPVALAI
jgi:diguanylate cyclase (GGDEF)-like protein/PAS domain S-box-containing protein